MKSKKLTILLIAIIPLMAIYIILSSNQSAQQLRLKSKEIDAQVDSISNLLAKYDSLEIRYKIIYDKLTQTRVQLDSFKIGIELIMHENKNSAFQMNRSLQSLIDKQDTALSLEIDTTSFRFN